MTITQTAPAGASLSTIVATRVRGLLAEAGMKGQDLGPILGVDRSSAAKRLRTDMPFKLDELPVLAEALNTSVEYLLGLTEQRGGSAAISG